MPTKFTSGTRFYQGSDVEDPAPRTRARTSSILQAVQAGRNNPGPFASFVPASSRGEADEAFRRSAEWEHRLHYAALLWARRHGGGWPRSALAELERRVDRARRRVKHYYGDITILREDHDLETIEKALASLAEF